MMRLTQKLSGKVLLRIAALTTAGMAVSGCTYDLGLGYASDGYGSGYYDCDPYSQFDSYYDCDNGYGFSNIGYGGGWYDNYWYPGYGFYLFDNYGQRYNMRDNHRRYWGERRHRWYRENRHRHAGGRRDGRGADHRGRAYTDNDGLDAIGSPERGGGRVRDGDRDGRDRDGDGRRDRNRGWEGGEGNGADAVPRPNPDATRARGEGRRDNGRGNGRNGYRQPAPPMSNDAQPAAPRSVPATVSDTPPAAPAPRQGRSRQHERPD